MRQHSISQLLKQQSNGNILDRAVKKRQDLEFEAVT